MPIIDLIGFFNNLYVGAPEKLVQESYYFDESPEICFVDDNSNLIMDYNDLPNIVLTTEEQKLLTQQTSPRLNESQILVKALEFNDNKIYIKAYKCDYKFLIAYGSGKIFSKDSPINQQSFFKTGSIISLITNDNKTCIIERNDSWKLFSSFSGFLKPHNVNDINTVITTALEEAQEEFFQYTDFKITNPNIVSVSLRKGSITGKFGTAEFVVTAFVNCTASELSQALDMNLQTAKKPDGSSDHTGRYKIIDLNEISETDFQIDELDGSNKEIRKISFFLVDPIINSACKFLGIEAPAFMKKETLNERILISEQTKENSWDNYLRNRNLSKSLQKDSVEL